MIFQLGSPLLDACVLAVLKQGDAYGYSLTQQIRSVLDISESTLYPILRRLQKEQFLETYDQPYQGRNRRYYRLTEQGKERLDYFKGEWNEYKDAIDMFMEGKMNTLPAVIEDV